MGNTAVMAESTLVQHSDSQDNKALENPLNLLD